MQVAPQNPLQEDNLGDSQCREIYGSMVTEKNKPQKKGKEKGKGRKKECKIKTKQKKIRQTGRKNGRWGTGGE